MTKKDKSEIRNLIISEIRKCLMAIGKAKAGEFISLKQAEREYNYSRASIYRLREKGLLQFHKIGTGKKSFIRRSEFELLVHSEKSKQ